MKSFNIRKNHGVTLIELMISMSAISILLTFAGVSMQDATARSEIKAATAEVVHAFRTAKNAARLTNSGVTTEIRLARDESGYIISFAFDAHQRQGGEANISLNGLELVDIELSKKISVSADTMSYRFDSLGMINKTGTISLVSTIDNEQTSTVVINNTMGYVTASYTSLSEETS